MSGWACKVKECHGVAVEFPALPTKQRPRWNRFSQNVYTPRATETAEAAVRAAWIESHGLLFAGWEKPVRVRITVARQVARSANKREEGRQVMMKPDLDNTAKLVLDALNSVAWKDDQQVVGLMVTRETRGARGARARIAIEVEYLDEREVI